MVNKENLFITFEGGEGAGKSTQAKLLEEYLKGIGKQTLLIREPGATNMGEKIRKIISENEETIEPLTELFLFSAARKELVEKVIQPALAQNITVICDRYIDSTIAYQHFGRNIELQTVLSVIKLTTLNLLPDLTILLDINYKEMIKRKTNNLDYFEREEEEFHKKIQNGYNKLAKQEPQRWKVFSANSTEMEISEKIIETVNQMGIT
ncbi:MAG: dTMP kinase [Chloroflexi bacterium]|nr:dTMP kinase [Chloroflexota bacterium]|tara:strand:+ start:4039 stop:4662 length:624 start_codon:yes stop_codon:yes gene_type:complete